MTKASSVLILGARGRFGLATARAFASAGWRVLGVTRPGARQPEVTGVEWLGHDLHDTAGLAAMAQGASVVVHALNPSAYTNAAWRDEVLPLTNAVIAIARQLKATLMVPGNVYNFGSGLPAVLQEDTPQNADTIKGHVRVAMEGQLHRSGVRVVVIRAGDFFGAGQGTWFDTAIVKDIRKGAFTYPGPVVVVKAWAYLPDLAATFVAVAQRRAQLKPFEVLHFAGHCVSGQHWLDALNPAARAQGWVGEAASLKLRRLPWGLIRLGALVVPTWKSLLEMRYLWNRPHALNNDRLVALLGAEPHTPFEQAAHAALNDLGLLQPPSPPRPTARSALTAAATQ